MELIVIIGSGAVGKASKRDLAVSEDRIIREETKYQNRGIGYAAIQKSFAMFPDVKCWKLETIIQEKLNCHLYEKCGFVRVGEEKPVNEAMTLIDYELNL